VILDIFCEIQRAEPKWSRDHERDLIHDTVELAKAAEAAGFDTWWQVEHHGAQEFSMSSSPELMLSLIAQNTSTLRVGHAGVLSPFGINHPLKVAERAAWMDIISNGRLELGLARSSGSEWENFGIDGTASRPQTEELFRMLPHMWNDEPFSWDSELITVPELNVIPKPLQRPHPALWVTGTSPEAFESAGRQGVGGLATTMLWPADPNIRFLVEIYRTAIAGCEQPAGDFLNNQFGCFTFVHVAETREEAIRSRAAESALWYVNEAPRIFRVPRQILMGAVRGVQEGYDSWRQNNPGNDLVGEVDPDDPMPVIRLLNRQWLGMELDPEETYEVVNGIDSTIIGDVDTCRKKMQKFADVGVDRLLCLQQFGFVSQEDALRSTKLIGEELIDAFR
jgi:alkanesulfonate monooxygenase SsuD/methylene tetrahydromethanopterin reductase-like flavin-dependent oxidoreductase (luciferase family)